MSCPKQNANATVQIESNHVQSVNTPNDGCASMVHIGDEIDGYELTCLLGEGTHGQVFEARSLRKGEHFRTVALKIARNSDNPTNLTLEQEALYLNQVQHPHIVRLLNSGRYQSKSYLVMERVRGISLREMMRSSLALTRGQCIALVIQICDVLAYLHGEDIVKPDRPLIHGDLKPSNMMVNDFGELKLIDFGVARPLESLHCPRSLAYGTPGYMAPEQITRDPLSVRADIYSIGVILYELITGTRRFVQGDVKQLLCDRLSPEDESKKYPIQSTGCHLLDGVVHRALQRRSEDRYGSIKILRCALRLIQKHYRFDTDLNDVRRMVCSRQRVAV